MLAFFFFNDTATTEIYTLSLHDALPISILNPRSSLASVLLTLLMSGCNAAWEPCCAASAHRSRSEEHTSELQSQSNLVCRLLLEKKKTKQSLTCPLTPLSRFGLTTLYVI